MAQEEKKSNKSIEIAKTIGVLGEGSYGTCTLIKTTKEEYMVKKSIKSENVNVKDLRKICKRSIQEAEMLQKFNSDNIMKCFGSKIVNIEGNNCAEIYAEVCYLDLEEFHSLRKMKINTEEKKDDDNIEFSITEYEEEVFETILYDTLRGLYVMHGKSIKRGKDAVTNRDLKPENILFGDGHFKIADFGIGSNKLIMNTAVGTIGYIAPDIAFGEYTNKVDYWAVGVIIAYFYCPDVLNETIDEWKDRTTEEDYVISFATVLNKKICNVVKIEKRFSKNYKHVYKIMNHCLKIDGKLRLDADKLIDLFPGKKKFIRSKYLTEEMKIIYKNFMENIKQNILKQEMLLCECTNPFKKVEVNKQDDVSCDACSGDVVGLSWNCNNLIFHDDDTCDLCEECGAKRKAILKEFWGGITGSK